MTNKKKVYEVLNSKFTMNGERINKDYLNSCIIEIFCNTENLFNNETRKCTSLAWDAFMLLTNDLLVCEYGRGYYCYSKQLKDWLEKYGSGYATISEAVSYVDSHKQELLKQIQDSKLA